MVVKRYGLSFVSNVDGVVEVFHIPFPFISQPKYAAQVV